LQAATAAYNSPHFVDLYESHKLAAVAFDERDRKQECQLPVFCSIEIKPLISRCGSLRCTVHIITLTTMKKQSYCAVRDNAVSNHIQLHKINECDTLLFHFVWQNKRVYVAEKK